MKYILIAGLTASLVLGAKFDINDGILNIQFTLNNFYGFLLTALIVTLYRQNDRKSPTEMNTIQEPIQSTPEKKQESWEDESGKKLKPILRKESYQESISEFQQSNDIKTEYSESDASSCYLSRSNSMGNRRSRKVSFDESLNVVHTFRKNNKKEQKNFELSSQQLKSEERKKKNELIKQKRRDDNFRKLNINDINKNQKKRKSSLDDCLSSSSFQS
ncbi:hypothetical protein pb186bvf_010208 [Paramecium bursaria]